MARFWWRRDDEFSLTGDWWISGKDEKIPGVLNYSPGGKVELRLHRNFGEDSDIRTKFEALLKPAQTHTIHGTVSGGEPVTLSGCFLSCGIIIANDARIGIHCDPAKPPKVVALVLKLSNFESWVGEFDFKWSMRSHNKFEIRSA